MLKGSTSSRTFSRRSIHGQVAHELGLRIVSGALSPQSILPNEENFSAELKVSRTAYREAIKVLAAKNLVESRPKTGTRVRASKEWNMLDPDVLAWCFLAGPSMSHARSLFEMRSIVEPAAAALAAERADAEQLTKIETALEMMKTSEPDTDDSIEADLHFHQGIIEACGNDLLASLGYLIESALAQSFKLSSHRPGARRNSIPLHAAVFTAIKERNSDQAKTAMSALLDEAWVDIEDVISELSDKNPN
jgi:DNA-binding FadR family transcriptional regulator